MGKLQTENSLIELPLFRPEALSRSDLDIFGASLISDRRFLIRTWVTLSCILISGASVLALPYAEWAEAEGQIQSRGSTTEIRSVRAGTVVNVSVSDGKHGEGRYSRFGHRMG
jgi:hypothetical protein